MDSPSAQLMDASMLDFGHAPSSPFVAEVETHNNNNNNNNTSPSKQSIREDMIDFAMDMPISGEMLKSPAKSAIVLQEDKENIADHNERPVQAAQSPRKQYPSERSTSPAKTDLPSGDDVAMMPPPSIRKASATPRRSPLKQSRNGARTPKSVMRGDSFDLSTPYSRTAATPTPLDDPTNVDDTCFSAFSEIPDMTTFARLRQSPSRQSDIFHTPRADLEPTPRTSRKRASPSRSPSPTPRTRRARIPGAAQQLNSDGTTSFLIDFTQQMDNVSGYRAHPTSPAKSATESNLLQYMNGQRSPHKGPRTSYATPGKSQSNILNLLDFELPPAPTPRSIPTITVRELESLKSSYLSQISSLKASLSGREAEVESLKKAIGDAERRAGEAQETLREEKCRREQAEEERQGWERRGQEVEQVLRNVKEEVVKGEAEKEDMLHRLEDADRRIEELEARARKAEERFAEALAARSSSGSNGEEDGAAAVEERVQNLVGAQIDAKIEVVSRELHTVYKEKHERKVATLKKSYEARSEKKVADLQSRISALEKENQDLQNSKDATFTGPVGETSVLVSDSAELKAQLEEQKASLARLQREMEASKAQQAQLERELQQERIEKGDLVAAVDEMLALQSDQSSVAAAPEAVQGAMEVVQDFRKSITRASGLKLPGGAAGLGESRIGRGASGGVPTPSARGPSGAGGKSKMLANIERMGRTGSKDGISGPTM